ncbi:MAG: cobyrinate a,c-diamide synthase [Desulfomonilaceae bacterium]
MFAPCPRIVVAGTNSGVGKTSVALGLVCALRKQGLSVQTFKVGPDYLDPTYLSIASGRPCYNLDSWMTTEQYVKELFGSKAARSDISVIEGAMGLFDGSDPVGLQGSTAEIAAWLEAPIILVTNSHGVARSIAAIVHGFATFDKRVKIGAVIANHCGSDLHSTLLGKCLESAELPPMVGGIPRGALPLLPSRHLGLVSANEKILDARLLDAFGEIASRYCCMDEIEKIARQARPFSSHAPHIQEESVTHRIRLGIANDPAFHFYYPDNLEALSAAGAELISFSPLADASLPADLDAVYLGGGYPEEFARELSENKAMIQSIRRFARAGGTIYAECGGLMYLSQGIESNDGNRFELVSLLPSWTRMLPKLKSLSYVEATLKAHSLFGDAGSRVRGHEFHYSELIENPIGKDRWTSVYRLARPLRPGHQDEGYQMGNVLASYVHGHYASKPDAVAHFVRYCHGIKQKGT